MPKRAAKPRFKPKTAPGKPSKPPAPRFAAAAFLSGSPDAVKELCQELATLSAKSFGDLTGTTWARVASSLVDQLRSAGHDLMNVEEADGVQEWQATWYHPRGTFTLFLSFQAPSTVEVTWKTDTEVFSARAPA